MKEKKLQKIEGILKRNTLKLVHNIRLEQTAGKSRFNVDT